MEQHSARIRHTNGTVPARLRLPRTPGVGGGGRPAKAAARARHPAAEEIVERLDPAPPAAPPRLTGLGTWVVITLLSMAGGGLDALLSGKPGTFFGLAFVAACVAGGLWVRPYDLSAAPISAPIAFTVALVVTVDSGSGGLSGRAMSVLTGLALGTGWLYAGTLCAAGIVAVRKLAALRREREERGREGA